MEEWVVDKGSGGRCAFIASCFVPQSAKNGQYLFVPSAAKLRERQRGASRGVEAQREVVVWAGSFWCE